MNLTEYLNQKDPIRMPRVVLSKNEYILGVKLKVGLNVIQEVYIDKLPYNYCIVDGWRRLYTMDSDGNPKSSSCFRIN